MSDTPVPVIYRLNDEIGDGSCDGTWTFLELFIRNLLTNWLLWPIRTSSQSSSILSHVDFPYNSQITFHHTYNLVPVFLRVFPLSENNQCLGPITIIITLNLQVYNDLSFNFDAIILLDSNRRPSNCYTFSTWHYLTGYSRFVPWYQDLKLSI